MTKSKKMSRQRDFGSPVKQEELEPVGFDLYGEHFDCYKQVNGVTLLTFVKESTSEDSSRSTAALLSIFGRVMNKTEHERFMKLCDDPDTIVPIETLSDIVGYLIEVYTDQRPTEQSEES